MITFALLVFLAGMTILALHSFATKCGVPVRVRIAALRVGSKMIDIAGLAILLKIFVYCADNFW